MVQIITNYKKKLSHQSQFLNSNNKILEKRKWCATIYLGKSSKNIAHVPWQYINLYKITSKIQLQN